MIPAKPDFSSDPGKEYAYGLVFRNGFRGISYPIVLAVSIDIAAASWQSSSDPSQRGASMRRTLMAGVWRYLVGVPPFLWEKQIEKAERKVKRSTAFMTAEHRAVHHFVVREMPRLGAPVSPERVAGELGLASERARQILQDLEKRLTFLYRNDKGEVAWAYPVTVEKTPHAVTLYSGECLYAA